MLYYLNDNYKGGETAFPVADNITLDLEVCSLKDFDHSLQVSFLLIIFFLKTDMPVYKIEFAHMIH